MRRELVTVAMCSLTLAALRPARLCGQSFRGGTVTGQALVELKRQPEVMRIQVQVLAKGKSLREALDKLREQRQTARRFLELVSATPQSIRFGDPAIDSEKNERNRHQMMMMRAMRNQMGKPGDKNSAKAKEAPSILVSCTLRAEVQLKATNPEELLLLSHDLEERIKSADLGGAKALKQASAQDEELAQEQADMMDPTEMEARKPGDPFFTYVCRVPEEDRAKALADAFTKAKKEASLLARAAGVELGELAYLDDNSASFSPEDEEGMITRGGSVYFYDHRMGSVRLNDPGDSLHPRDAIGKQPNKVYCRLSLTAAFAVKKPSGK